MKVSKSAVRGGVRSDAKKGKSYTGFFGQVARDMGCSLTKDACEELDCMTQHVLNEMQKRGLSIYNNYAKKVETVTPGMIRAILATMTTGKLLKTMQDAGEEALSEYKAQKGMSKAQKIAHNAKKSSGGIQKKRKKPA